MAPIVSFPLILHVAESVNFPTFELQGVMPIERLVDLRMKRFSRQCRGGALGRAARWGHFTLPGAGVFRRVGNKRRRARARMLPLLLGFDVEGAGLA